MKKLQISRLQRLMCKIYDFSPKMAAKGLNFILYCKVWIGLCFDPFICSISFPPLKRYYVAFFNFNFFFLKKINIYFWKQFIFQNLFGFDPFLIFLSFPPLKQYIFVKVSHTTSINSPISSERTKSVLASRSFSCPWRNSLK